MVVKPLKQQWNIHKAYKHIFRKYQNQISNMCVKYQKTLFQFRENKKRFTNLWIFIICDFRIIHIFHCLGSHARGHFTILCVFNYLYEHPSEHLSRHLYESLYAMVRWHSAEATLCDMACWSEGRAIVKAFVLEDVRKGVREGVHLL